MKQSYFFLAALITVFFLFACGDSATESASSSDTPEAEATSETEETPEVPSSPQIAVCLWNEAGLRDKPGRGKNVKYLATVNFGEVVVMTGEEETKKEGNNERTYIEVELSDGKKGWSNGYLFGQNAVRAVALGDLDVYKRPDLTTFEGKKFERGEIFALAESDKPDWMEVYGKERKKQGWIQKTDQLSTDEIDVTVAIMYDRAMREKSQLKQKELLENLTESGTLSKSALMNIIDEQLAELTKVTELPSNQLYISTDKLNVRSLPLTDEDNVVFQVNEGDICTIIERGERQEIRDMNDYWYKIEFNGQEGWVYGHYTSKRMAE